MSGKQFFSKILYLFPTLNDFNLNVKLTIELNPERFLDTKNHFEQRMCIKKTGTLLPRF